MSPAPQRVAPATTTVVLVDDHELIRQGLKRAFDRTGEFVVVGEAGSVTEAKQVLAAKKPAALVVDMRLPDGSGIDLVRHARTEQPALGIVVLTMYAGDEHIFAALEAGASAYVSKDAPADDVVAAARHAVVSPWTFTAKDLAGAMQRRMTPTGPRLSPREREVLDQLVDGLSISQISRRLYISESTTKTHVAKIYEKLGAGNRAQAVMAAVRLGLVKGPDGLGQP